MANTEERTEVTFTTSDGGVEVMTFADRDAAEREADGQKMWQDPAKCAEWGVRHHVTKITVDGVEW